METSTIEGAIGRLETEKTVSRLLEAARVELADLLAEVERSA